MDSEKDQSKVQEMNNVTTIDPLGADPHFNVFAMCTKCTHRWIGTVHYKTSLFKLECPQCHQQESFASIIPIDYASSFDDDGIFKQ